MALRLRAPNFAAVRRSSSSLRGAVVSAPVGQQCTELPPRAALRVRDYSFVQPVPLNLLGKDAVTVGKQFVELYPRAAVARSRDYSLTQPTPLNLIGKDAVLVGKQLSGNAPAGPRRASTLTDPGSNQIVVLNSTIPVIPCGLSTLAADLPTRAPTRVRDYTYTQNLPLSLVGKDNSNPGLQFTELPPRPAPRATVDTYSLSASLTPELVGKDLFYGAPGQVPTYDWSYLPPKPRYQQGTGEPIQDLLSTLLAVIPPGQQSVDLTPKAPSRAKDYTFALPVQLQLLGRDAMAPGVQSTDLPRGPLRARDYIWLQSLPKHLIGQDSTNPGDQFTDLPPRGPARLRDYSIAHGFTAGTRPQEKIPPGSQLLELSPRTSPRAQDYTLVVSRSLALSALQRDLLYIVSAPQAKWFVSEVGLAKWRTQGLPPGKWHAAPPGQ